MTAFEGLDIGAGAQTFLQARLNGIFQDTPMTLVTERGSPRPRVDSDGRASPQCLVHSRETVECTMDSRKSHSGHPMRQTRRAVANAIFQRVAVRNAEGPICYLSPMN
jgi:hypothetical protein